MTSHFTPNRVLTALIAVFVFPILGSAPASHVPASHVGKISGSITMEYSDQHPSQVGDADGHMLMVTQAKGKNVNTGKNDYMSGAEVLNTEIADLQQGNGPHRGYIIFSKDGERTVNRWSGTVKTVLSADSTPVTTFEGTWSKIAGTGRYADVKASGRYHGQITSKTGYKVEWNGGLWN